MAQWYHFYHTEDDAELIVGLYDRWLRQLDFGPTPAERYLLHTEMMETAHERRFVVAQAGLDMSSFETDHSRRIDETINHLERNFINRFTGRRLQTRLDSRNGRKMSDTKNAKIHRATNDALVEMMGWAGCQLPDEIEFGTPPHSPIALIPSPSCSKESVANASMVPVLDHQDNVDVHPEIDVDDGVADEFSEEKYRAALVDVALVKIQSKRQWGLSDCCSRTIRDIRLRKKPKLQDFKEMDSMQQPDTHKTSNMSLNVLLN